MKMNSNNTPKAPESRPVELNEGELETACGASYSFGATSGNNIFSPRDPQSGIRSIGDTATHEVGH